MKIYTKTGDKGLTSLANGKRISKADARIEAYGTADEVNSTIGWLRAAVPTTEWGEQVQGQLQWIQNRLFDLGAILAGSDMPFASEATTQLEQWIDQMQDQLPALHAFILPAGSEVMTRCHIVRTQVRRLERAMCSGECEVGSGEPVRFVNRLSDYAFVLSRWVGKNEGISAQYWEKA